MENYSGSPDEANKTYIQFLKLWRSNNSDSKFSCICGSVWPKSNFRRCSCYVKSLQQEIVEGSVNMEYYGLQTPCAFRMYKVCLYIWMIQCIHTASSGAPLLLVAQSKDGSSALAILGDEELINGRSVFLTTMTIRVKITGHRYNI